MRRKKYFGATYFARSICIVGPESPSVSAFSDWSQQRLPSTNSLQALELRVNFHSKELQLVFVAHWQVSRN